MCSRLIVLCVVVLLNFQWTRTFEAQITRKQWTTDKIVKIQDEFQADNVFSYALCKEDKQWGYVNLSCKVFLETFMKSNVVQEHECRSDFNRTIDSLLHIRLANRNKIILTNLQQSDNSEVLVHVIRIIDVATCQSNDIKVNLNQELLEMSSVQGTKVFTRDDNVFEVIYDIPGQLCDNAICKMTFNAKGQVLSNFEPISRQPIPIDESVVFDVPYSIIFKYLYPLVVANRDTEYFIVTVQTSGDIPLPQISERPVLITLMKANSQDYEVLEILKFNCYGFDRQKFIDIDASNGHLSVCFKDYKAYGPTMMRCRQFDRNWKKTMEVDRLINNNNVNAIKVKTLRKGELLLATHENEAPKSEQRVYVRRIESSGRHEAPIFISDVSSSQFDPWDIDYFTNFYQDKASSFCLMGWYFSYTPNYFQHCEITRMCFSKQLVLL